MTRDKTLRNGIVLTLPVSAALWLGSCWKDSGSNEEEDNIVQPSQKQERDYVKGPVYSESVVPKLMCSRYVRYAARDLFGVEYPAADAWDMRKNRSINHIPLSSAEELRGLARNGAFSPGEILGVYNPNSRYNGHPNAKEAGYTHVMLFVDQDEKDLYFADKFGSETRTHVSLTDLLNSGLRPVEILEKR